MPAQEAETRGVWVYCFVWLAEGSGLTCDNFWSKILSALEAGYRRRSHTFEALLQYPPSMLFFAGPPKRCGASHARKFIADEGVLRRGKIGATKQRSAAVRKRGIIRRQESSLPPAALFLEPFLASSACKYRSHARRNSHPPTHLATNSCSRDSIRIPSRTCTWVANRASCW